MLMYINNHEKKMALAKNRVAIVVIIAIHTKRQQ